MLRWPKKAWRSVALLFAPLQDVDVYVEDHESQVFYGELLKRLVGDQISIVKAIPLDGRQAVEAACSAHVSSNRPSLYLVDGDLDWVAGQSPPSLPLMYRLQAYCIENFLICEHAASELATEADGKLDREEVRNRLSWPKWIAELRAALLDLSVTFAAARSLAPDLRTVSYGYSAVCEQAKVRADPQLSTKRAKALCAQIVAEIVARVGEQKFKAEYGRIKERVDALSDPLRAVSGKDFLLPLLRFRVRSISRDSFPHHSFRFRLAKHCSLTSLFGLRDAILTVAKQKAFVQDDAI